MNYVTEFIAYSGLFWYIFEKMLVYLIFLVFFKKGTLHNYFGIYASLHCTYAIGLHMIDWGGYG